MKVALVYDRVNKWGGAERVLLALHELFPNAPLYTSVYNPQKAPWANVFTIYTSFLQKFPFASETHELYASFMPLAFETFSFDEYDLVISVTSEAAKGIITKPHTKHICYCLTPTRYLWSAYAEYFANEALRFLAFPAVWYLRKWDKIASQRVDQFVAISNEVKNRITKYYQQEAPVVYPPLTFGERVKGEGERKKTKRHTTLPFTLNASPYFLIVSRLVGYKRIDLAIQACNELKLPLKIIGAGMEEQKLKDMAGETIEFLGNLTDEQVVEYYRGCSAFIFPGKEDFGLTMLEAQSLGKPVIAYKAGGAVEIIQQGKTGEFFSPQTVSALRNCLEKFDKNKYNPKICIAQARKFRKEIFFKKFTALLKTTI